MKRTCMIAVLTACFVLPAAPAGAQTTKEALQAIPDHAIAFVVVNGIAQTGAKIDALAKKLAPGKPINVMDMLKQIGDKGVNVKGSAAVAFVPDKEEDDDPVALAYVPVTDYAAFIGQFKPQDPKAQFVEVTFPDGKQMVVTKKGGFAVVTPVRHREQLEKAVKAKADVSQAVKPLHGWIAENDLAAVATPHGVRLGTKAMRAGFKKARDEFLNQPGLQGLAGFLDKLDDFMKSLSTELTHAALGGKVEAGNLHVDVRVLFAPDGEFARAGKKIKAMEGGPLAGLPSGPYVFAMGGAMPEKAMQAMTGLSLEMFKLMGRELPAEDVRKMEKTYESMLKGFRGTGVVYQLGKPGDPLLKNLISVTHVENGPAYLKSYVKANDQMNEILKNLDLPLPPTEIKKVKVNGMEALESTTDMGAGLMPEEAQKILDNVFGPGGKMTMSFAALEKAVYMRFAPADTLKEVMQAAKKDPAGLAKDPQVAKTAAMLPKGSQWAIYINPRGVTEMVQRGIDLFAPGAAKVPQFAKTPPLAVAARISSEGLQIHAALPAALVDGLGEFIQEVKKAREIQ